MRWNVQYSPYLKDKICVEESKKNSEPKNGPYVQIRHCLGKSAKNRSTIL